MGECQGKSCICSFTCLCISFYFRSGFQRICDRFAFRIDRKFLEASLPAVFCCQSKFLACCFAICIKFCFYFCRADSILIICIVPGYRNRDICNCCCMRSSKYITFCCISTHLCIIIGRNSTDLYCVFNICSRILRRQAVPDLAPAISFSNSNALAIFCTVCKKLHAYRFRTNTVLVVCIIPFYRCFDTDGSCFVSVCQCKSIFSSCCFTGISFNINNFQCIGDCFASFIYCKIFEASLPAIFCCQS